MVKALLIITEGSEEMELTIACDVLRRGNIEVTVAGVEGHDPVVCRSGLIVKPDKSLDDAMKEEPYEVVVLPGGGQGAETFCKSEKVKNILKAQENRSGLIAAICAAPTAIKTHNIYPGKKITSYPVFRDQFDGYDYCDDNVVEDGNLITSRGPATAFDFSLKLVERLVGKSVSDKVSEEMLM